MNDKASICICGHWENWHVNGLACEVCAGYRRAMPQPCLRFRFRERMSISGPVGKDLETAMDARP